jgi:hypothetical protein
MVLGPMFSKWYGANFINKVNENGKIIEGKIIGIGNSKGDYYLVRYYYKYTVLMGDKYTRNQCYEICFQYSHAIPICNCADPSVNSNVNNATVCGKNDAKCLEVERSAFTSSNCDTDCPEACERGDYSYKVSTSSFPTV